MSAKLRAAQAELSASLLNGADTRPLRTTIAAIEKEIATQVDAEAARLAEIKRAAAEAIADRARTIAGEASVRFAQTLDGLMPPPSPV